jgi:hypothetical protein
MKTLEPVIFVREIPPACSSQRQHLCSIRELVSAKPHPREQQILSYLAEGVDCGIYNDPGMLYDVLQPGTRIDFSRVRQIVPETPTLHPHLMMTDGSWVWPGALLYYIAAYHVRLPDRFVHLAERCQWKIDPGPLRGEELNWDAFDAVESLEVEAR